jgi:hypothetical protein
MSEDEALKLALDDLMVEYDMERTSFAKRVDEIFKQALAAQQEHEPENEPYVSLASVQEPVLKPLSKKWKWVLHESFADVAGFDEEGFPSFYWQESVTKFKSGELSVPCKGKNCGSMNGWLHSVECRAEHEAQYTAPPAAQPAPVQPVGTYGEIFESMLSLLRTGLQRDQQIYMEMKDKHLYTTPPAAKRTWTGLTDEEEDAAFEQSMAVRPKDASNKETRRLYAQAIEAKLKEKNTP